MENWEIVAFLQRLAGFLTLKGENEHKIRAYHQAARSISRLDQQIEGLAGEKRLGEVPGIGTALASKIEEYIYTGKSRLLEKLEAEVPSDLLSVFSIPGVGTRTAMLLMKHLELKSMEELESAARAGRVRSIPGLGLSLERKILGHLENRKFFGRRVHLGLAVSTAVTFQESLESNGLVRLSWGGDLRRGVESVDVVDLVVSIEPSLNRDEYIEYLRGLPRVVKVYAGENSSITLDTVYGIPVRLHLVDEEMFPLGLLYATGSPAHLKQLEERAAGLGYIITEGFLGRNGKPVHVYGEEDIYRILELDFIPPEVREGKKEMGAFLPGQSPSLIWHRDIKGDLHVHTDWTDGRSSLEQMVEAARLKGYSYIAITDHSPSLQIAGGLSVEKLFQQGDLIRDLRQKYRDIYIFTGVEVDILRDGSLDLPDEILSQVEVVVASIHSGFAGSREELTSRLEAAALNPLVDIIAHPTGRLIGRREPYQVNLVSLFATAARAGTALEINAAPDRLDLNDINIGRGREKGAVFAVNTDAHSTHNLDDMLFGVTTARRGWLGKDEVLNTYPLKYLKWRFSKNKNGMVDS